MVRGGGGVGGAGVFICVRVYLLGDEKLKAAEDLDLVEYLCILGYFILNLGRNSIS
jgi:hypothetical protein